jgi:putative glutamine amidotransferase
VTGPVVALTSDLTTMSWAIWRDVEVSYLPWAYMSKVVEAGGSPIMLPPVPEAVEDVIARADALLLTGGPDIEPSLYGAQRHPRTLPPNEKRDRTDMVALAAAQRRGIPVLGLCRGLQILVVARGGTLHQHLPEHSPTRPGRYEPRDIHVEPDSRLGTALGSSVTVHCHHHQGVDQLGTGLVATAWSPDGIIEGAEDPEAPFVVGVQAHGEVGSETAPLFKAFVDAAADRRSGV